jgi:hypothetical protein
MELGRVTRSTLPFCDWCFQPPKEHRSFDHAPEVSGALNSEGQEEAAGDAERETAPKGAAGAAERMLMLKVDSVAVQVG